jgi:hypothetical protein
VGVKGHGFAFAVRVPSMAWLFAGQLAALYCFGIAVPLAAVLVYVPAIVLIMGMPVSVQGIGPAQVAQVALFAPYVQGDARMAEASILAWGLSTTVGSAMVWFLVGVACLFTRTGRATLAAARAGEQAA